MANCSKCHIRFLCCLLFIYLFQSFKSIAKVLGSAIGDRPDLRMDVMSSLRKLIVHSLENGIVYMN